MRNYIEEIYKGKDTMIGITLDDVLNKYQDKDLILSPNLRKRGTKIGFYGFRHLIKINSLEDLKNIIKNRKKEE